MASPVHNLPRPVIESSINPARLRKTAKATAHAATIDPVSSLPNGKLPKSRREREKAEKNLKKERVADNLTAQNVVVYTMISVVFYACIAGWIFGYPVFDTILGNPIRYVTGTVTFPVRYGFNLTRQAVGGAFEVMGSVGGWTAVKKVVDTMPVPGRPNVVYDDDDF
ncbi:hypothetical protein HK101_000317 [Irineochytrium annulatum]|nr:hypothetical protein HK101_000317 [Irineochytrium annulatum]